MNEFIAEYGYLAVFLLAGFDHSGTPLGVLLSIGFVTTGELALLPTLVIATIGGIFGDLILYSIGFFGGNKALNWFKTKNKPIKNSIMKAEEGLKKYGAIFLIWGRFITFVGRYMALVYGAIRYKLHTFIFFSSIGGILVTLTFGLPAYFIGSKANEVSQNQHLTLYITVGLILVQIVGVTIWSKLKKSLVYNI